MLLQQPVRVHSCQCCHPAWALSTPLRVRAWCLAARVIASGSNVTFSAPSFIDNCVQLSTFVCSVEVSSASSSSRQVIAQCSEPRSLCKASCFFKARLAMIGDSARCRAVWITPSWRAVGATVPPRTRAYRCESKRGIWHEHRHLIYHGKSLT